MSSRWQKGNESKLRSTWITCFVLLLPALAEARIVNVESAASRDAEEGLSAELAGSLLWATGNTDLTQASGTFGLLYLKGPHRLFFSGRAVYGLDEGETYVSNVFEHLRYRHRLTDLLSGETFVQHEYDEFRRLQFRALFGVGPRAELLFRGWEVAVGSAWMLEVERFSDDGAPDAGQEEVNHRWSSYLAAGGEITEGIDLSHTFYVQPRFDDFSDHRLLSESAAVLEVKDWLAVRLSFVAAYDSSPPDEVDSLDTTFNTSLLFRL